MSDNKTTPIPRPLQIYGGTSTQEDAPWTRDEIVTEMLDLTTDAFSTLRSLFDQGQVSKEALAAARWVLETNLKLVPVDNIDKEEQGLQELARVLKLPTRGR